MRERKTKKRKERKKRKQSKREKQNNKTKYKQGICDGLQYHIILFALSLSLSLNQIKHIRNTFRRERLQHGHIHLS